jgi:hypothetical protein
MQNNKLVTEHNSYQPVTRQTFTIYKHHSMYNVCKLQPPLRVQLPQLKKTMSTHPHIMTKKNELRESLELFTPIRCILKQWAIARGALVTIHL